jgi:type 1 fimbria pilin
MKMIIALAVALAVLPGSASLAPAGDETVTLEGTVMCAKCTLKKEGASECQDVLVVKTAAGNAEYYLEKNDVTASFGHACQATTSAKVTGTVTEKDDVSWITASAMEKLAS